MRESFSPVKYTPKPVPSKLIHILAVDDVPDNLLILESILGDVDNYHIDCVDCGEAALEYLHSHVNSQQVPDLILLDVMMPGIDGYEVTRRIRDNKDLPYIPILLVTAHDQSSLAEGLDSGADDFIRKPFDVDELMARVRSLLRLKHSLDEQAEMLRQRDDFVARLTHDLRTPLVAGNRMLSLVLEGVFGEPPGDMDEAIKNVISNNENLLNMTNTLLQVYRHEAGQKKMVRSPLSAYSLAQEVVKELEPLASEKGISIHVDAQLIEESPAANNTRPDSYRSDPYRTEGDLLELRRLLTNLVGNAIKFTDTGHITVHLSLNHQPLAQIPSAAAIEIAVEDTGIGISADVQEQIFEWFYQGDHMRAGSGLGLHLSKRIAEMHQGTLTLSSEMGKGSTFTLSLPRI
jgi:two-component system, sensor histidine kinase and response regulator